MIVKFFLIVGVMAITYYLDCTVYSADRCRAMKVLLILDLYIMNKNNLKRQEGIEKMLAIYRSTPFFYTQTREELYEAAQQDPELAASLKAGRYVQMEKVK